MIRFALLAAAGGLAAAGPAAAQLNATVVGTGFNAPVFAASAPGDPGTLYVVQQNGQIFTLNTATGQRSTTPFLDLGARLGMNGFVSGGEEGLLGLAFHPSYQTNGRLFVNHTAPGTVPGNATRIAEFTAAGGTVAPGTGRTILQFDTPNERNHNAGWIGFSPTNGLLHIGTGDSGGGNDPADAAQNLASLQGKMLRINVDGTSGSRPYAIPPGNLPVATGSPNRDEIYAYGLRNPYRASFDRATGNLYIGDVGQNAREEVDLIRNGETATLNFGWDLREGTAGPQPAGGSTDPIAEYAHSSGLGRSVTGGYVYRGPAVDDSGDPLDGTYFFGDFVSGRVFSTRADGTMFEERTAELGLTARGFSISSFAEDGYGNLYMLDINGTVYQIVPVPEPATVGLVVAAGLAALRAAGRRAMRRDG